MLLMTTPHKTYYSELGVPYINIEDVNEEHRKARIREINGVAHPWEVEYQASDKPFDHLRNSITSTGRRLLEAASSTASFGHRVGRRILQAGNDDTKNPDFTGNNQPIAKTIGEDGRPDNNPDLV